MESEERRRVYEFAYRILKTGAILSVYPKHCKSDEPLWDLADMELEDVIEEIETANFYLEITVFKQLIHDDNYNISYILNFRQSKER